MSSTREELLEELHKELINAIVKKYDNDDERYQAVEKILDVARESFNIKPWELMNHHPEGIHALFGFRGGIPHLKLNQLYSQKLFSLYPMVYTKGDLRGQTYEKSLKSVKESEQAQNLMTQLEDLISETKPTSLTEIREYQSLLSAYHPLLRAIMMEDVKVVQRLLDRGAEPNDIRPEDLMLVFLSAEQWSPALEEIMKLMILNGYNTDKQVSHLLDPSRTKSFSDFVWALQDVNRTGETDYNDVVRAIGDRKLIKERVVKLQEVIKKTPTQRQVMAEATRIFMGHLGRGPGGMGISQHQHPGIKKIFTGYSKDEEEQRPPKTIDFGTFFASAGSPESSKLPDSPKTPKPTTSSSAAASTASTSTAASDSTSTRPPKLSGLRPPPLRSISPPKLRDTSKLSDIEKSDETSESPKSAKTPKSEKSPHSPKAGKSPRKKK